MAGGVHGGGMHGRGTCLGGGKHGGGMPNRGHAWWGTCLGGGKHGGGMPSRGHAWWGTCLGGGKHGGGMPSRGHAWWEGMHSRGHAWQGDGACVAGETATAADGTHPTGMDSCSHIFSLEIKINIWKIYTKVHSYFANVLSVTLLNSIRSNNCHVRI